MSGVRIRRVVAGLWGVVIAAAGVALLAQADGRTRTANYTAMRAWSRPLDPGAPMHPWAVIFLLIGLLTIFGVLADRVPVAKTGLIFGTGAVIALFGGTLVSAVWDGGSYTAPIFGAGIVGAHLIAVWRLTNTWGM